MEPSVVERDTTAPHTGSRGAGAPGAGDACAREGRACRAQREHEERGALFDIGGKDNIGSKDLFEQGCKEARGCIEVIEESRIRRGDAVALATPMKRLLAIAGA